MATRRPSMLDHGGGDPLGQRHAVGGEEVVAHLLLLQQVHVEEGAGDRVEIGGVAGDVEADHVGGEQGLHDLRAPGQDVEHVRRGEGRVVEEGDLHVRAQGAEIAGHEPEVVVMDPDHGALGGLVGGGLGEGPVDFAEDRPVHGVVIVLVLEGMEDRPEGLLRGDVVEAAHLFRRQGEAGDVVGSEAVGDFDDGVEFGVGRVFGQLPRDPGAAAAGAAEEAFEGGDDAVGALVLAALDAAVHLDLLIGLAVVDDDEIGGHGEAPRARFALRRAAGARRGPPQPAGRGGEGWRPRTPIASRIPPAPMARARWRLSRSSSASSSGASEPPTATAGTPMASME